MRDSQVGSITNIFYKYFFSILQTLNYTCVILIRFAKIRLDFIGFYWIWLDLIGLYFSTFLSVNHVTGNETREKRFFFRRSPAMLQTQLPISLALSLSLSLILSLPLSLSQRYELSRSLRLSQLPSPSPSLKLLSNAVSLTIFPISYVSFSP